RRPWRRGRRRCRLSREPDSARGTLSRIWPRSGGAQAGARVVQWPFMAQSPAAPAPPEVKPDIRLDDLPVAETELEPPYRVLIHNDDITTSDFLTATCV